MAGTTNPGKRLLMERPSGFDQSRFASLTNWPLCAQAGKLFASLQKAENKKKKKYTQRTALRNIWRFKSGGQRKLSSPLVCRAARS
ncbi:unnamed protein product [Bursaphelenchus xylophilus]|uniref:(pine wood nematode) hypothetical protein n=1 Tax=Bursaphelenchus xylophilus TaxID=6326 RepID=A0A1I7SDS1_BURXY|nr:unnamed protein product [Bursaphelenchus xylophilus]CAG9084364.1 unnamed protein product [Bursaphelenchus xylophilus]